MSTLAQAPKASQRKPHPAQVTPRNGVRGDLDWRRPKAPKHREELSTNDLVRALVWIDKRAGARRAGLRGWSELDEQTTAEAEARAWSFGDLQKLTLWSVPAWFDLLELPRRLPGYERFLASLVRVYRGGAIGLSLSYEEAIAIFGCAGRLSRTTWRAWTLELEALRLIRCVQTWRVEQGRLVYGRMLYRIGPALEELAGAALVEGPGQTGPTAAWSRRMGRGLRDRARDLRRQWKRLAWQRCRGNADASASSAEPSTSAHGCVAAASDPTVGELGADVLVAEEHPSFVDVDEPSVLRFATALRLALNADGERHEPDQQAEDRSEDCEPDETDDAEQGEDVDEDAHHPIVAPPAANATIEPEFVSGSPTTALYSATLQVADPATLQVAARSSSAAQPTPLRGVVSSARPPELAAGDGTERETPPAIPPTDGAPDADCFGGGEARGVERFAAFLATRYPTSSVGRDAVAAARASIRAAQRPRCEACDGAGGTYGEAATNDKPDKDSPGWSPTRRTKLDGWIVCDRCGGSGDA